MSQLQVKLQTFSFLYYSSDSLLLNNCLKLKDIILKRASSSSSSPSPSSPSLGSANDDVLTCLTLAFFEVVQKVTSNRESNQDLINISALLLFLETYLKENEPNGNEQPSQQDVRRKSIVKSLGPVGPLVADNDDVDGLDTDPDIQQLAPLLSLLSPASTSTLTSLLPSLYSSEFAYFWISCPSLRRAHKIFSTLFSYFSSNPPSNYTLNADIRTIESFWSVADYSLLKQVNKLLTSSAACSVKTVYLRVKRTKWLIEPMTGLLHETDSEKRPEHEYQVKCRLLGCDPKSQEPPTSKLVLHVHGGGFVSQSPESHEVYLKDWLNNGFSLLSVAYPLSPATKFPTALLALLDVYLYLINREEDLTPILGIPRVTEIVVVGDSSGGNLVFSLLCILNEIDNRIKLKLFPSGVVCIYTPFNLKMVPFSSSKLFFSFFDIILPFGVLLSCLDAYLPSRLGQERGGSGSKSPDKVAEVEEDDEEKLTFKKSSLTFKEMIDDDAEEDAGEEEGKEKKNAEEESGSDSEPDDEYVFVNHEDIPQELALISADFSQSVGSSRLLKTIWKLFYTKFKGKTETDKSEGGNLSNVGCCWYRSDDLEKVKGRLREINKITGCPFVSPLFYPLLGQLSQKVNKISIVSLKLDPFYDDSLFLINKLRGEGQEVESQCRDKVTLDVVEGLCHGFLNFVLLSEEARRLSRGLIVDRIKQAFYT